MSEIKTSVENGDYKSLSSSRWLYTGNPTDVKWHADRSPFYMLSENSGEPVFIEFEDKQGYYYTSKLTTGDKVEITKIGFVTIDDNGIKKINISF
jgi:hypothetical protein